MEADEEVQETRVPPISEVSGGGGTTEGGGGLQISRRRPEFILPALHPDLQLSSHEPLYTSSERQLCSKCGSSRRHYCPECLVPFTDVPRWGGAS